MATGGGGPPSLGSSGGGVGGNDSLSQNIKDQLLQCKICLDGLTEPKTLPCLHTFCATCITYHVDRNRVDSRRFCCPVCRRHIYLPKEGVAGFPDSFFVSNLRDMITQTQEKPTSCGICKFKASQMPSSMLCVDCKVDLCDQCAEQHSETYLTADHTLLPLKSSQDAMTTRKNYCRVHKSEIVKYYCSTCNSPVCLPCTFLDHQGHAIQEIKLIRSNIAEGMERLVLQSRDNLYQMKQTRAYLVEIENEMFIRKEAVKTDIRRAVHDIIEEVKNQEAEILVDLDDFYNMSPIARDKRLVDAALKKLEEANSFAENLLSEETSPITQIVNHNEATESLQQALRSEMPDVSSYEEQLKQYAVFFLGNIDINLGSLLRRSDQNSMSVNTLRHTLPNTRAIYSHTIKALQNIPQHVLALAFTPSEELVVLTANAYKIKIFTRQGQLCREFGDEVELEMPSDVAATRDGTIAVTDCGRNHVKVFYSDGVVQGHFGDGDIFSLPISITVDHVGYYIVCDQAHKRLTFHSSEGELMNTVPLPETRLTHEIRCTHNKLYLSDQRNKVITVYTYHNTDVEFMTRLSAIDGSLVASSNRGNTSAPLEANSEAQQAGPSDAGSTSANNEEPSTSEASTSDTDNLASHAAFFDCAAIATDQHGSLYIADQTQGRLHCVNSRGEINSVIFSGQAVLRPSCLAVSRSGLVALCQQGVETFQCEGAEVNSSTATSAGLNVYRMANVDR